MPTMSAPASASATAMAFADAPAGAGDQGRLSVQLELIQDAQ